AARETRTGEDAEVQRISTRLVELDARSKGLAMLKLIHQDQPRARIDEPIAEIQRGVLNLQPAGDPHLGVAWRGPRRRRLRLDPLPAPWFVGLIEGSAVGKVGLLCDGPPAKRLVDGYEPDLRKRRGVFL